MSDVEAVRSTVENLKSSILKQRESKPKSSMTPGSSPLNLYAAEILSLRSEGFGLEEIAHALYLHHQIKIGKAGLSAFIIRYNKKMSKRAAPETTVPNHATSIHPTNHGTSNHPTSMRSAAYPGTVKSNTSVTGSESGPVNNGADKFGIVPANAGEFVSTQTREQIAKKDREFLNGIAVMIDSMSDVARGAFNRKHGNQPEHFEKDLAFWKAQENG